MPLQFHVEAETGEELAEKCKTVAKAATGSVADLIAAAKSANAHIGFSPYRSALADEPEEMADEPEAEDKPEPKTTGKKRGRPKKEDAKAAEPENVEAEPESAEDEDDDAGDSGDTTVSDDPLTEAITLLTECFADADKKPKVKELLEKYGVERFSQVKASQVDDLLADAKKLHAE